MKEVGRLEALNSELQRELDQVIPLSFRSSWKSI